MEALIEWAEGLGLKVKFRDLGRRHGEIHSSGLVLINPHRTLTRQRVTLAHECGHAFHQHDWTRDHDQVRDEREADQYAARLLISPDAYAAAEDLCGPHPGALARELQVTRRLVELRQEDFKRDLRILATVEQWRRDTWAS